MLIPRAIGRPYEWSVMPRQRVPERERRLGHRASVSPPSLQVECIWKSPRYSRPLHDVLIELQAERLLQREVAQVSTPESAKRQDLSGLACFSDRVVDGW